MLNDRENIKTVSENRLNLGEIAPEWSQYATDWFKKLTVQDDLACRLLRFINTLR